MKRLLLWSVVAIVTLLGGLFVLALRNDPVPGADALLPTLVPQERAALDALCRQAGIDPQQLHMIGGWYAGIFDHAANRRAAWIDQGRVRALRISGWPLAEPPDLRAFGALERLWLDAGRLERWPDLTAQAALVEIQLRDQPALAAIPAALPPRLEILGLAGTRTADLGPLAQATALRQLDLARTQVADFSPLVDLGLDRVDLSGSQVAAMPQRLPSQGAWSVNLDDTPVLNPAGFDWKGPGGYSFVGVAMGEETRQGSIGSGRVDVRGTGARIDKVVPVSLPTVNDQGGVYDVTIEGRIQRGRLRIWLQRPLGFFTARSPWFGEVDIDGFGFAPRMGYVHVDLEPGRSAQLTGQLWLPGPVEHHDLQFIVQPLGSAPAEGFEFHVRKAP